MWLIFLCSTFHIQDSVVSTWPMITAKLLIVNHNGLGEHFTVVLQPSHTLWSFPLLASWRSLGSTWHACIPESHLQRREQQRRCECLTKSLYRCCGFHFIFSLIIAAALHQLLTFNTGCAVWTLFQGPQRGNNSLAATGMQTVNRESKQVDADRSSFRSFRSLVLDRPRSKTNDIQFYTTFNISFNKGI